MTEISQIRMTKGERSELGSLIRKREKVLKSMISDRALQMEAEFEKQIAQTYRFDDDSVWKKAAEAAKSAVEEAQRVIEARCEEMGIPKEFAPSIHFQWYDRGENAVRERRSEMRRVAICKIRSIEKEANSKIEVMSLNAQTEIVATGLESDSAKAFLQNLPTIEKIMPALDVQEIKQLAEKEYAQ